MSSTDSHYFTKKLIERWQHELGVETRYVSDLVTPPLFDRNAQLSVETLYVSDLVTPPLLHSNAELVRPIREVLMIRATPDSQGWLAALSLWYLRNHLEKQPGFPPEVDLLLLIKSADFSVAPLRAIKFGHRLEHETVLSNAFVAQLLDALDGKLSWRLDNVLMKHLLTIATSHQLSRRASQIRAWIETHPDVSDVRTKYLSFLLRLPPEFSNLRADAARQTAKWLGEHRDNSEVRTQYLSYLLQLPAEFSDLRADFARQTAKWLEEYGEDTSIRAQYLSFLLRLPAEFSDQRADAAMQTAEWLEEHGEDIGIRRQYLAYVLQLPAEFSDLRADAARQTAKWLETNGEETTLRSQFLFFLSEIPYSSKATGGMMTVDEWQQLSCATLKDAANLTIRSGWQSQHQALVTSYYGLHLELFRSLNLLDSDVVRKVLKLSHDVTAEWFVRYPSSSVQYDLPLP